MGDSLAELVIHGRGVSVSFEYSSSVSLCVSAVSKLVRITVLAPCLLLYSGV